LDKRVTMSQAEGIETGGEVAAELARRGLDPQDRVTITIEPEALRPRTANVTGAGRRPADHEVDPLNQQAQEDVETVDLMEMYRDIV